MESEKLREQGVDVQIVVIHEGATLGANTIDGVAGVAVGRVRSSAITEALQDTSVDLVIAGHTHRITNTVVGHIPVIEGVNAGGSYSVAQLMVRDGDVAWVSAATRVAKNLGVAPRADVQAIVNQANADTAVLRNQVIGTTGSIDILRDSGPAPANRRWATWSPTRCVAKYPGVEAALTNSGGLRQDICGDAAVRRRSAVDEITWGEVFAVLPFGNRTVIETITGRQLTASVAERAPAGVQPGDRHRTVPAGVRAADHLQLHGHRA